jgi:hypothetical protein
MNDIDELCQFVVVHARTQGIPARSLALSEAQLRARRQAGEATWRGHGTRVRRGSAQSPRNLS